MPAENMRIKEAVCIHTRKVYDSCKDRTAWRIFVYTRHGSQAIIDRAINVKCRKVELLWYTSMWSPSPSTVGSTPSM